MTSGLRACTWLAWAVAMMPAVSANGQEAAEDRLLWDCWVGKPLRHVAFGAGGETYVPWRWGLKCLDRDGRVLWDVRPEGATLFRPPTVGTDGTIYVMATVKGGYYLIALSRGGEERWRLRLPSAAPGKPVLGQGATVVVPGGFLDSTLFAITDAGQWRWRLRVGGGLVGASVGSDGTIYAVARDGNLYAVSADGQLKWKFNTGTKLSEAPCISVDGTLYLAGSAYVPGASFPRDEPALLYAISPTGECLWEAELPWTMSHGQPVLDGNGHVLVLGVCRWSLQAELGGGTLYVFSHVGEPCLELAYQAEGLAEHSPGTLVVDDAGRAYVWVSNEMGKYRRALVAVDLSSGLEEWRVPMEGGPVSMSADGMLCVGSGVRVYGLASGARPAPSGWPMTHADPGRTGRAPPSVTAVMEDGATQPRQFGLLPAYPNPFNASVAIRYELAAAGKARLAIYDVVGQLVEVLVDEEPGAGTHQAVWDAEGRASGVYLVELRAGEGREVRRVALVR